VITMSDSIFWKLEASTNSMGIKHEYVSIGGDLVVGSLLSQIVYWHRPDKNGKSKLRVKRHGHLWIAKTRKKWMQECRLTRKQYIRALSVLKQKGLIEVRVMRFAGKAMSHTRLLTDHLATALQVLWSRSNAPDSAPDVPDGDNPVSPNGTTASSLLDTVPPSGSPQQGQPYTDTTFSETTTEITNSDGALLVAKEECKKVLTELPGVKLKTNSKAAPTCGLGVGKTPIGELWQSLMPAPAGGFQVPLTQREQGQLKYFAQGVGEAAGAVLTYTIANWGHFAFEAKAMAGLSTCPTKPNIGYLLKHRQVAVNLYVQSIAKPAPPIQEKPQREIPEIQEMDAPYRPAPDEIHNILAKFQGGIK